MKRDAAVHTLGNLTLVTVALNPAMSNGPWSDHDAHAAGIEKGGSVNLKWPHDDGADSSPVTPGPNQTVRAKKGKRSALAQSVLLLNADLTTQEVFDENVIAHRGETFVERVTTIWARPVTSAAPAGGGGQTPGEKGTLPGHIGAPR